MKSLPFLLLALLLAPWTPLFAAGGATPAPAAQRASTSTSYLITNDDSPREIATSGTFFTIGSDGLLQNPNRVSLGGSGEGGGYFNSNRVSQFSNSTEACAYLSVSGSNAIGAVDIDSQQDIGNFSGSTTDSGMDNGIGLANNGTYLYASFAGSSTIATFAMLPGCSLNFLGDISAVGLQSGNVKGMAIHGNLLVVTYGDGSLESYNISAGIPVSNGDLQNATGYAKDIFPVGVDITQDGHYAIFGDQSTYTNVEVSDISSGKLTQTVLYNVGNAGNSASIYLSPDETLLYIANTGDGRVTAAFFNATTGKISPGCTSARLKRFATTWTFLDSPVTELNTGTGSVLYLAEYGNPSTIAIVDVTSSGGTCSLIEAAGSPIMDPNSTTLLSIGVYPPRQF
ncbi:MAG TPA: hypothetical protein VMD99_08145 [Terriglobales bacterium]|nr:hypothetical protein [Terriglobales bacterium]